MQFYVLIIFDNYFTYKLVKILEIRLDGVVSYFRGVVLNLSPRNIVLFFVPRVNVNLDVVFFG